MIAIMYGRTPQGQLLYDLAYTDLSDSYLARKHRKPVAMIRRLQANKTIRALRRKVARDRNKVGVR